MPAGPGTSRVRRGGPRHGRRTTTRNGPGPVLAGVAGLVLGLGLGSAGWAVQAQPPRHPALTEREVAVAVREAQVARLEQRLGEARVAGAVPTESGR